MMIMNRRAFASHFAILAFLAPMGLAADLPAGEDLIQRFIDSSGGTEAYARTKNVEMTGTVELAGRNLGGKVSIVEAGEKTRTTMELAGIGRIEQGFDGETAWENSALQGPRVLEGEEKNAMKHASTFALMTSWRDEYKSVKTVGEEDVEGKAAWKVEMTPKEGKPEIFYFDKSSGLLIRISATVSTPLGEIPTDVIISDYRKQEGMQTPFSLTQSAMGQTIAMKFTRIVYNGSLAKDVFDLPEPVKAVLAKKK
jgi:hypothetical protein